MPVCVVLEQRQRRNQRHQPLPVVLDEAQQLDPTEGTPTFGRRCLRSKDGS
jgi:hypothetical protein